MSYLLRGPRAPGVLALVTSAAALGAFKLLKAVKVENIALGICFLAPWFFMLASLLVTGVRLLGRRRAGAVFNSVVPLCAALLSAGLMLRDLVPEILFSEEPDLFGRDIVIPEGLHMRLPAEAPPEAFSHAQSDPDGDAIKAACTAHVAPGAESRKVSFDLRALDAMQGERLRAWEAKLRRDPAWAVLEERGKRYACRRFVRATEPEWVSWDGGVRAADSNMLSWVTGFNGYTSFDNCQVRIVIGLEGPVFAQQWHGASTSAPAIAREVVLETERTNGSVGPSSYLVVQAAQVTVEIYDEARSDDRAVTRAALALLEHELAADGGEPAAELASADQASTLDVVRGMQGGMYTVYAYVNPGEPGYAYLRVFEHTRNTRLSPDEIAQRSKGFVGWSKNPRERFQYQAGITVYEGDWGVYYPGRFELWFVPESGAPERKLSEDVFRIEGWMR